MSSNWQECLNFNYSLSRPARIAAAENVGSWRLAQEEAGLGGCHLIWRRSAGHSSTAARLPRGRRLFSPSRPGKDWNPSLPARELSWVYTWSKNFKRVALIFRPLRIWCGPAAKAKRFVVYWASKQGAVDSWSRWLGPDIFLKSEPMKLNVVM